MFGMNKVTLSHLLHKLKDKVDTQEDQINILRKRIEVLQENSSITVYTGDYHFIRSPYGRGQSMTVPTTEDIPVKDVINLLLDKNNLTLTHTPKKCFDPKTELVKKPVTKRRTK